MQIYFEGGPLLRNKSGVGYYTYYLLDSMAKLAPQHQFFVFGFLFFGKAMPKILKQARPNIHIRFIRFFPGKIYHNLLRRLVAPPVDLLLGNSTGVYFFPNFVRWPLLFRHPSVVVIYDLSYALHGQYSFGNEKQYLARKVPQSIAKSGHVITISENSKQEIMDYYHLDEKQITVAPPAVDSDLFKPATQEGIARVKARFGIKHNYILYTGTLEPRKNLTALLEAYSQLPPQTKQQFVLVLAGGKGWNDTELLDHIHKLQASGESIVQTGYVSETDMPALYSGATVFVFPSFYEGFGMPPLEAMACGVPVIASNTSSLPEVVGRAGELVDPNSPQQLERAIIKILGDPELRATMVKHGLAQVKTFSWDKSASKVIKTLEGLGQ